MADSSLLTASSQRNLLRFLKQVKSAFNTTTGHDHDGTNSKAISASVTYGVAGEMAAAGIGAANAAGSTAKSARIDHVHAINYGLVGSMAAAGTGTANAVGTGETLARIDHVHALGTHDHSGATKGGQIGPTAFAADAFTADAAGRAPFQDGIWPAAKLANGCLSADATGRAKVAAAFFGAGDATSRAIFADLFMDSTFCAAKIADNAIPGSKVNWSYGVTPGNIAPDDTAAGGSSAQVARIDHTHGITCAAPSAGLAAADAEGAATSFARSNHVHKATITDAVDFTFGASDDAVIRWSTGDASNHSFVIGLADANQAVHITDKTAVATDWDVVADTHPSLYIHSDTTPATDYIKIWHDATDGFIDSASGNLVLMAGGAELVSIETGTVVFNEASADVDYRVESNDRAYALYIDGAKNAIVMGSNTDTSDVDKMVFINRVAHTGSDANTSYADLWVAPGGAYTTANNTRTYAVIATAYFGEPNITKGGTDTITEAATVYIAGAPTEGSANWALRVAAGGVSFASTLVCGGAITASAGIGFADQSISGTTGNLTMSGAGYVSIGASPAASGYLRLPNAGVLAWRNQAGDGDISALSVDTANDVLVGADLQLGGNALLGNSAANGDLTLTTTTSGTKTTSYILPGQMIDASVGSIVIRTKAGAPGDGEAGATDIDGELAFDTTNHRFYFREGGAWHYVDRTAGFGIPTWEQNCPVCGESILLGDAVSGVIDKINADGSRHGLWAHSRCVKAKTEGVELSHLSVEPEITDSKSFPSARERMEKGLKKVGDQLVPA